MTILKLEPQIWFAEMIELLDACAIASPSAEKEILDRAYALQLSAPIDSLSQQAAQASERFRGFIAVQCYIEAAFCLAESPCTLMVSRSANGRCICTAVLEGHHKEAHFESSSLAISVVGAFLGSQVLLHETRDREGNKGGPQILN